MKKTATAKKAASTVTKSNVIRFEILASTPGAVRYQEHVDGVPLVNDADGAQMGGLYFRKALFDKLGIGTSEKPAARIKITVEVE